MDLWVALMDEVGYDEHILGVYSSEELALEVANLASSPEAGGIKHYVLDELPGWLEGWVAELAAREKAESA
jgi:hypothetical protein